MKIFVFLLLLATTFPQNLQNGVILGRGTGIDRYLSTAQTDSFNTINDNIRFYGTINRTVRDTGSLVPAKFIAFKYDGGTYDSTGEGAILFTNGLILIAAMIDDSSGSYYASVIYKTKNNVWIYDKGDIEAFITPLKQPSSVEAFITEDYTVHLFWAKLTRQDVGYTQIWRKYNHPDSNYTKIDSVLITEVSYSDGGLTHSAVYKYKIRHRGNSYSEFVESNAIVVDIPDYQLTFEPDFINVTVDSTVTDTTITILATNNSGGSITLNDITGEALPFTVTPEAVLPQTILNGNDFSIDVTLYRDTSGTFSQTLTFDLNVYNDQTIPIYASVTQPPPADTTAPDPIDAILATGYNVDGIPKTFIKVDLTLGTMSNDADSIYWYRSNVNSLTGFTEWQRTSLNILTSNDTIPAADEYRNYYVRIKDTNGNLSWANPSDSGLVPSDPIPPPPFDGTRWYVGKTSLGLNNGTSWANRWTLSSLVWASIQAGDIIYLDGGTDSVVYTTPINITRSGSWGRYITITAGKYSPSPSGHSGKVILDHNYTGGNHGISILGSIHWVKIMGITIRHTGSSGIYLYANATSANPYRIWIDSCEVYEVNADECVEMLGYFSGNPTNTNMGMLDTTQHIHHIEISRCTMYTHTNRAMPECNIIYGHLTSDLWIHHNTLWQRNLQQGGNDHIDPIQLSYSNYGIRIYNNILLNDSCVTGHTMILGLMSRGSDYADTSLIYNNYIYSGGEYGCQTNWKQEILWRAPEGDLPAVQKKPLVYSINNTIVARNGYVANSAAEGQYNPLESNNIIAHYGVNGSLPANFIGFWYTTYSAGDYKQVDSNKTNLLYMAWGGVDFGGNHWRGNGGAPTGNPSSWADYINPSTWGGTGVNANPQFIHNTRIPTGKPYEIGSNSPAINAGTDMRYILNRFIYLPMFNANTDIEGNPIVGNRDIGCFEYQP